MDLLKSQRVKLVVGDGRKGYAQAGPYHAIHVGAGAKKLPEDVCNFLSILRSVHVKKKIEKTTFFVFSFKFGISFPKKKTK